MTNVLPAWPEAEQLAPERDEADVITEELRTCNSAEELRVSIHNGLGAIYGGSPLVKSFGLYHAIYTNAQTIDRVLDGPQVFTLQDVCERVGFRMGMLMATHANVRLARPAERQFILSRRCDEVLPGDFTDPQQRESTYQEWLVDAYDLVNEAVDDFDALSPWTQRAVMDMAEEAFDDHSQRERSSGEMEFVIGYVFANDMIKRLREHHPERKHPLNTNRHLMF